MTGLLLCPFVEAPDPFPLLFQDHETFGEDGLHVVVWKFPGTDPVPVGLCPRCPRKAPLPAQQEFRRRCRRRSASYLPSSRVRPRARDEEFPPRSFHSPLTMMISIGGGGTDVNNPHPDTHSSLQVGTILFAFINWKSDIFRRDTTPHQSSFVFRICLIT